MDKLLILNSIQKHYGFEKDTHFAEFLGIAPQNLSKWKARCTFDAELIYTKCTQINSEWLLTGKGEMLKSELVKPDLQDRIDYKELYFDAKYTIDVQKKYIQSLEVKLNGHKNAS